MTEYFGKYRGRVENNLDPLQQGRIQVNVPAVLGEGRMSWAMPSAPYAGPGVGFFAIPPNGANVWVEFESGNPDYPIWSGCFWGVGEVPALPAIAEKKVFKTENCTLTLDDTPGIGGVTIEMGTAKIAIDMLKIEIKRGAWSVKISDTSVSINEGALEVT